MRHSVVRLKNLKMCIKQLEPFIRDGEHLQTGKQFQQFGDLRSRELLANWLLCVVLNFEKKLDHLTFTSDPQGGDGLIYDSRARKAWPTEYILVPRDGNKDGIETAILNSIRKKLSKGGIQYALGKTLVVFLNANGDKWYPNSVARSLPKKLDFLGVWIVGLRNIAQEQYNYNVTVLNPHGSLVWIVSIGENFESWKVKRIQ
jgi:hypothetical protein